MLARWKEGHEWTAKRKKTGSRKVARKAEKVTRVAAKRKRH